MPLGGGDIGCNVWVENGDLLFYIQRSGSLSEIGEYLKLGRVRIRLDPNPFVDYSSFCQKLILKDGVIQINAISSKKGKSIAVNIKLWVEVNNPVVHIDIDADCPVNVTAAYENWRTKDRELRGNELLSCFTLDGYPGKVIKKADIVEHTDQGVLFYHRNPDDKLVPDELIKRQGLEAYKDSIYDDIKSRTFGGILFGKGFVNVGCSEGIYVVTPYKSWEIKSKNPQRKHQLMVATHIQQSKTIDEWKNKLSSTVRSALLNPKKAYQNTINWWHQFWERSHIVIYPENPDPLRQEWQMARNYQLFRYQLGCNVFGEYPTKFNGGNLTFDPYLVKESTPYDPDWRAWGGDVFTAQNQRLLYWPMLKSGDFDAILPQFELFRKGLPGAQARVRTHFNHNGAIYAEYTNASGLVFGAGWGWEGKGRRARGKKIPFGDPQATGVRGYNDLVEEGIMANQSCAYHWESQLEHAYMMMELNRFTGTDIKKYIPFIKAALLFFDEHYKMREKMRSGNALDENGKLVIYPSTSCETYRGATNPVDLISGLNACIKSILLLDDQYVSASEKNYFKGFLNRIPDYTFGEENGTPILKPAKSWGWIANVELPQLYPLFPFNEFKLGDDQIEILKNTYRLAGHFQKGIVQSWHQDGIFLARMGMTNEAAAYNIKKLRDSERRFPTFWGPGYDWVPDHNWGGAGMIGLQEMLLQTIGRQIVLFPAWPKDWDVDFKLHAPYHTIVECSLKGGKIIKMKVTPKSRAKDIIIKSEINKAY